MSNMADHLEGDKDNQHNSTMEVVGHPPARTEDECKLKRNQTEEQKERTWYQKIKRQHFKTFPKMQRGKK